MPNKLFSAALLALICAACGKDPQPAAPAQPAATQPAQAQSPAGESAAADAAAPAATEESAPIAPTETVTETEDAQESADPAASNVQSTLRLATATPAAATQHFKEGANYRKVVPAQPTNVAPGKVEVVEFFWYGCGHCFQLDPALESWRNKGKPAYVEFVRVPGMWNDTLRMHARLY